MSILDEYVTRAPSRQNVLDIFKGEWSSALPAKYRLETKPGTAGLFEDARIVWAMETLDIPAGQRILELGPLEGGHSYMLQHGGAHEVIAVEANTRAFLKCLCIKQLLDLDRVQFLLGDFIAHLRNDSSRYDAVIASGVLYHMDQPLELLELIARVSGKVMLWTHYYDRAILEANRQLAHKFSGVKSLQHQGVTYEYSTQSYKEALSWAGFCGGNLPTSKWLTRDSLMLALSSLGFTTITVAFDDPAHQNGPALAVCARRA